MTAPVLSARPPPKAVAVSMPQLRKLARKLKVGSSALAGRLETPVAQFS
jgi:hypothetical protein